LVFENFPADSLFQEQSSRLNIDKIRFLEQSSYPLTMMVVPGSELLFEIKFDSQHFDPARIAQMLDHLRVLLESFVTNFNNCISALSITTEQENELLSNSFNLNLEDSFVA